jgi:hypothetical protein
MSNWVRGLRRITKVATILCVALAMPLASAHAQSFNITNLTRDTASKASFPTMVIDAKGNINLVWVDSASGIMFARSTDGGKTFAKQTVTSVVPAFQPQMVVYQNDTNVIGVAWAAPNPSSTSQAPTYDVFASRSDDGGAIFKTTVTAISGLVSPTGVPLFDSPRIAIDTTGTTDVVWGQNNVWISQAVDGKTFGPATSLIPVATPPNPPIPPPDTGGPRIAVSSAGHIFVAWTDESLKAQTAPGNYCTNEVLDAQGTVTNTYGGNFWINETLPSSVVGQPVTFTSNNTRNLSTTDWKGTNAKFPLGFFGCSYDNLNLYVDKVGLVHMLWSDDTPLEDVLSSKTQSTYPAGSPFAGETQFSFPINLANVPAASPQVTVDNSGNIYVVWSGGPTGGNGANGSTNSQGIFFSRSDAATPYTDTGNSFTSAINIAPKAIAPAFPQIAVDANSNVNVVWEQPTAALKYDGSDVFNVFFARSTDKGNTFPTVLQVTSNPSVLCFKAPPPPEGTTPPTNPTTPNVTTCGTVQIGVDATSTPDMAWVNQASGSAIADIDFATPIPPAFTIGLTSSSASALAGGTATFTVQITPTNGFNQSVTLSCPNLPTGLTCSFNPATATSTSTLTVSTQGSVAAASYPFTVTGTSGSTTNSKSATLVIGTITASVSPTSATIAVLSSANFTLNLSSTNGFNGTVNLDCPGLPAGITCTFNPTSTAVPGAATLTVAVSAKPTGSLIPNGPHDLDGFGLRWNAVWTMVLAALALILSGMIAAIRRQTPVRLAQGLAVVALVLVLGVGLISCGGSTSNTSTSTTSTGGSTGGGGGSSNPFTGQITVRAQSGGASTNVGTMSITVP